MHLAFFVVYSHVSETRSPPNLAASAGETQNTAIRPVSQAASIPATVSSGNSSYQNSPSAWASAEQEKLRLYNEARSRAIAAQSATGASLNSLGWEDDSAPPEYAPPVPAQPAEGYKAPSRPVSMYTSAASPDRSAPGSPVFESSPSASLSTPPTSAAYMSAADEKEQQRLRFENAQNRVVSSGRSQPGSLTSPLAGPSEAPTVAPVATTGFPSASDEKAQQRRLFEEAQNRVVSAGRKSAPSSFPDGLTSPINGESTHETVPNSNTPVSPHSSLSPGDGSSHVNPASDPSSAPSGDGDAMHEKEQMRRYYDAQDKVAQASSQPRPAVSPPLSPQAGTSAPNTSDSSFSRAPSTSAGPVNEKEQMRRYYEAMERVQRASGAGPGSMTGFAAVASALPPIHYSPPRADSSASASTSTSSNGFMSAADEKAMMRKRFDDAQNATQRNVTPSSQPTTASRIATRSVSSMSSSPGSPLDRDPTVKAGKAKAAPPMSPTMSVTEGFGGGRGNRATEGPPPPLPEKPPMDYINLLSPVKEIDNPWGKILGGTMAAGNSNGS